MDIDSKALLPVIADNESSADLRSEALRQLAIVSPAEAVRAATQIVADQKSSASLVLNAVGEMGLLMHFSSLSHNEKAQIHDGLRSALAGPAATTAKMAALRHLAPAGDDEAKKQLDAFLADPSTAPLSVTETISLLRFYPDRHAAIRQRITSVNDDIAVASIQALYKDEESSEIRRNIAADRQRAVPLRKVAIQSIMHDDSIQGVKLLIDIFADAADNLELRTEAISAARVYSQRMSKQLSDADKNGLAGQIRAVPTGSAETSELGALKAQILEVLSAKK